METRPLPNKNGSRGTNAPAEKATRLLKAAPHSDPNSSGFNPSSSLAMVSKALFGDFIICSAVFLAMSSESPFAL